MKTLRGRQYSFKQETQIKLQNKVLGPLASNIMILSHKLHSIFYSLLWGILNKGDVSHSWNHCEVGNIPLYSKLSSQG
jgi:hypothetical protein